MCGVLRSSGNGWLLAAIFFMLLPVDTHACQQQMAWKIRASEELGALPVLNEGESFKVKKTQMTNDHLVPTSIAASLYK
jgi:hypothetical protein